MAFTLWSHNKLLGESDFELVGGAGPRRLGVFRPSALGATLLPTLTGIGPALLRFGESTEAVSFARQVLALHLELRDPRGNRLPTQCINVHDLVRTLEASGGESGAATSGLDPDGPRYFLSATLAGSRRQRLTVA